MPRTLNVYLCGPMAQNTPEQANGWRLRARDILEPAGFTVVSPMREKEMLEQGVVMGVDYSMYGEVPELRAQSIFSRDTFDVRHADIVLANMTELVPDVPSLGSDIELGMAWAWGKKVVLVAPPDNYYRRHPFPIALASIIFNTLEEGCGWIVRNFRPYVQPRVETQTRVEFQPLPVPE